MKLDFYTGHYTNIIEKKSCGSSFSSTLAQDGKSLQGQWVKLYGSDDTYQSIQIKGCLATLKKLVPVVQGESELAIVFHSQHNHPARLLEKVVNIFDDIRRYNTISPSMVNEWRDLVNLKMRKKNRSKYDNHDELVEIVMVLLQLHFKFLFAFTFVAVQTPPKHPLMKTAIDFAELHFEKSARDAAPQSNVIAINAAR